MKTLKKSLKRINWKLFIALLIMGLCPTIYTTLRTFFTGQLPNEWAYSIAGQLSWVNLLYEIIDEAIILPLFFFMGNSFNDKNEFSNKIKTGMVSSLGIYAVFSVVIMVFIRPMLGMMATSLDIINESVSYIRIEAVANVFGILYRFICVALVVIGRQLHVYILTGCKLVLSIIFDIFFVSNLSFSLKLGINGIGYSNIIVSILLTIISVMLIFNEGYLKISKSKWSFAWMKNFIKVGGISGLESFVRNIAYMLMVSRMVNMVGEQGTYWVANNFIWGWLLLPILQLGELIKQEVSKDKKAIKENTPAYYFITTVTVILWIVLIPFYKPFMQNVLGFTDVDKLFELVMLLMVFYIFYAFQNIFDATFYGRGKTSYMLFESIATNSIYYGTFFIAYLMGVWVPSLTGIAIMFGFGNVFDSVVSWIAYRWFLKRL